VLELFGEPPTGLLVPTRLINADPRVRWRVIGELLATSPCKPASVTTRVGKARTEVNVAGQLDLFDDAMAHPLPTMADRQEGRNGDLEGLAEGIAHPRERADVGRHADADRVVLRALEEALADAREDGDDRPAFVVLASCLGVLGAPSTTPLPAHGVSLREAGDDWLRRLETQQKSESTLVGYRVAIDDLLDWSETNGREILTETGIVDYLHSYQERAQPAEASYYRRFVLLRKFVRWVCRRDGVPDPFLDLDAPPKPRQERDWLTPEEFRRLLDAAGRPERNPARPRRAGPARVARPRHDGAAPFRAVRARMARPRARRARAVAARPLRKGQQVASPASTGEPRA
jgi:hypothetical protein